MTVAHIALIVCLTGAIVAGLVMDNGYLSAGFLVLAFAAALVVA